MKRSWRTGEHSDWTLILGAEEFKIHKVIVATGARASAFLAAAFREHCGKRHSTNLTDLMPRQCWPFFHDLLDFLYGCHVELQIDNWGPMVKLADLLQIRSLYKRCIEVGGDLITPESVPSIVTAAVELELGGELRQEIVQIAVDTMAPHFSSYKPTDLALLPLEIFQMLLRRDDLDVLNEDQVFEYLLHVASLQQSDTEQLWRCCRFHHMSAEKILDVIHASDVPREALVWALACRGAPACRVPEAPAWAAGWAAADRPRGREISFLVQSPAAYSNKRQLRSPEHQLCEGFRWRLLVFPLGTESTGSPKQMATFVELVPEHGLEPGWTFRRVKYTITLLNWSDPAKSITKEHVFDFSANEVDNGWHRGWVTPDNMTAAQGWLNENMELCLRARCDIRNAVVSGTDAKQEDLP